MFTDLTLQAALVCYELWAVAKFTHLSLQVPHGRYQVSRSLITDHFLQGNKKRMIYFREYEKSSIQEVLVGNCLQKIL
jgi:hypothetical protein